MRYRTSGYVLWAFLLASLLGSLMRPVSGAAGDNGHLEVGLTPEWTTGIISDGAGASHIVVTDLNQDSVTDVVACSNGSAYVLNHDGAGDYGTAWFSEMLPCFKIAVGDRDGNGVEEIYVATQTEDPKLIIFNGENFRKLGELILAGESDVWDLEVGDVDGDGGVEAVLVTFGATHVYDATTLELKWKATDKGGMAVEIGDIDGDGDAEIVVNGASAHILNAKLQQEEWAYSGGFGYSMDLGDVDADGIAEIAFLVGGPYEDSTVQVLDADTLATKWQIARFGMQKVEVADTSGDGSPEVLVGDGQWGSVTGYEGDTGAELWSIANPEHGVFGIGAGDMDNDGTNEVIWGAGLTSSGKDALFVGDWVTESVEWGSADLDGPLYVAAGDVDVDGQVEIVTASQSTVSGYEGGTIRVYDGTTHQLEWSTVTAGAYYDLYQIAVGQLDADPAREIVVGGDYWYSTRLMAYDGITHEVQWDVSKEIAGPPRALLVADLDADAVDEIIVGLGDGRIEIFNGASPVIQWESEVLAGSIADLAIGDLDGNSVLDLAVLTSENVHVIEAGTWIQRSAAAPAGATELAMANDDLSGPGELLILTHSDSGSNLLAWNADFVLRWQRPLGQVFALDIASGELDGDGDDEFVVMGNIGAGGYTNSPSLLLIGSQITFSAWNEYEISGYWGSINGMVLADVDNDSQLELTFGSSSLIQVNEISSTPLTIYTAYVPTVVRGR